ncbi:MAG: UbiA family prenyltransferase [Anaerolineae bacterium]|nr:UbiA family prenyltransferase [Phycisphaerae bacterium]
MLSIFSQRLLTVLQLSRMALVFTAISDSLCAVMIWAQWRAMDGRPISDYLNPPHAAAVAVMSLGLYGFGMSLNDINDRRRDSQMASHRPIPSGRIGVVAAHVVCAIFGLAALIAGLYVTRFTEAGALSFVLLIWTALLITFYDFAGKYLVAPGLLTLGLIRFFHATIAAPRLPLLWHPLLLLNHVTVISTIAYVWEAKRPPLTRVHWWAVLGGLACVDVMCIALVGFRRYPKFGADWVNALWITPGLALPAAAAVAFAILVVVIRRVIGDTRRAGQTLMLYGLMWLIVYDAAFVTAYVRPLYGALLLLFLPLTFLTVQFMRWWTKVLSLSQKPQFQRAR